jgi:Ser/Thr protein kinase RdoA (MazF antagonist)
VSFEALSPDLVIEALETAHDREFEGSLVPYSSYVNRVYGVRDVDGEDFIVKFYRAGRWTDQAILQEHSFLAECAQAEIPAVVPLPDASGETLSIFELEDIPGKTPSPIRFALFPKIAGRSIDIEKEEDWLNLGRIVGRLHSVGALSRADARPNLGPELARDNLARIRPLIHPEISEEFSSICMDVIESTAATVRGLASSRIHGDLHRGNILSGSDGRLVILDFDDMMNGPKIQDLWLLLPGLARDCGRELGLLREGYSVFGDFDSNAVGAIEALRFYRMLHFLAWRAGQREDSWFVREFPDWGTRAFWIRELEDFREQAALIEDPERRS